MSSHTDTTPNRLVVGISGASGIIYGLRMLDMLRTLGVETHLVMSDSAALTLRHETDFSLDEVTARADYHYPPEALDAAIASGSFRTRGMVVAPCSMRSLSAIAHGLTATLLTRAADVTLKERRPLVLMTRETPLHLGHLRNMVLVTEMGAIVAPPVPAFYARPADLDAMVTHTAARVLDLLGFASDGIRRWGE